MLQQKIAKYIKNFNIFNAFFAECVKKYSKYVRMVFLLL